MKSIKNNLCLIISHSLIAAIIIFVYMYTLGLYVY